MDIPSEGVLLKLKRPSLQTYAKKFNIKANISNSAIIKLLLALKNDAAGGVAHPQPEPRAPKAKSKRKASGGHDADANSGNEIRASKKSRFDKELRAHAPSETILNANPPELDGASNEELPDAHDDPNTNVNEGPFSVRKVDEENVLREAARSEARFMTRTVLNPPTQSGGPIVLPRPVPNGIARLNQATGRRNVTQTVQSGSAAGDHRVLGRLLPVQEDAADVVEGIQHDLGRSNSKGKERAIEHDEEVHPNRLEGRMGEEDERYRFHRPTPTIDANHEQGEMVNLRQIDENGQIIGSPIMVAQPTDGQPITVRGGEILMLRPADVPQPRRQIHSRHADSSNVQRQGEAGQEQLVPGHSLQDQPTVIVQEPDPEVPMAKLHSAKVLFEKIDALTSESLGTEGGESGIPNLMTQRDRQPRVAELHRRATSLAIRVRAEQWRFERLRTYMDYWNPDSGRECTSRAVLRSIDAEKYHGGAIEYVGPISDEELWGDAAEANKMSGIMDEHYGLIRETWQRRG